MLTPRSISGPLTHIRELDGLRGLAVLMVVIHHAGIGAGSTLAESAVQSLIDCGWIGVDLFFALSGFLITRILLASREKPDYFRQFYWKRTKRILPLYILALSLAFALAPGWWILKFVTYTANLTETSWTIEGVSLGHFWSLCVEEHFYLIWPAVIRFTPTQRLPWVILGTAIGPVALRFFIMDFGWSFNEVLRFTPCRLDSIALGSGLALFSLKHSGKIAVVSLLAAFLLSFTWNPFGTLDVTFGRLLVSLGCVGLVAYVLDAKPRLLADPWLVRAGELSYGIYVWHYLFASQLVSVSSVMLDDYGYWLGTAFSVAGWLGLGVVLATVSERLVEKPVRNWSGENFLALGVFYNTFMQRVVQCQHAVSGRSADVGKDLDGDLARELSGPAEPRPETD